MAEVVSEYSAHGTHTKFAAVLKSVSSSSSATTTTITVTATGRHYNNDTHSNTVSASSFTGEVKAAKGGGVITASPSSVSYPTNTVSVAAGKGKTADGNDLTFTFSVARTPAAQTVSSIQFNLTSTVSYATGIAIWGSNITVPAATISFSPQTLGSKTFSTSAQTSGAFTSASGGSGNYSYTKGTEKNANDTTTNYFTLNSNRTFTIAANTPASTYKIGVTAKDTTTNASSSVIIQITIAKASISPTVTMAGWTYGGTATNPSVSGNTGGGTVTYNYKVSTAADSTYTTTKPSAAGTYMVRASIAATTNYNAGTATANFTIAKANISPTVSMAGWTYGGTATNPSVSGNSGNGTVTYNYKVSTAADSTYTTTKPSAAGTYTVRASIAATTNYNAGTATVNFTIAKATPNLTVTGASLTYTGSAQTLVTNASVDGGGTIYYGLGSSTTSAPASTAWSTTKPTATNEGSYYIWAKADASSNYNAVSQVYKATATITANAYVLTIDPNGGTWGGTTSVSTAAQKPNTTKSIAAPTRNGYVFVGWAETGPGRLSKITQADPSFDSSVGGVAVYNNSGGGTVTHTRQSSSAGATYGSYEILISSSSGTTSPGNGGFYVSTQSAAGQKYIHVFVAKIPVGYTVQQACNATGTGRTITWLTSRKGTGTYQVYAYQHNCGPDSTQGTFSTFGHVYLDTGSRPVSWNLAYTAMTNITNGFADTYTYGVGAGRLTALWAPIVPMRANINGTWKTGPVWLNINGTWKQALEGYVNINGTWKQIK